MDFETVLNAVLIIVLVVWIGIRQLSWRRVDPSRLWRLPVALAAIGAVLLGSELAKTGSAAGVGADAGSGSLSALDAGMLVFELLVSLAVGAVMGRMAHFRPAGVGRDSGATGAAGVESRTGWWGMALWVAFIALRVALDLWAAAAGSQLASSMAVILILLAANRAARAGMFALRLSHTSTGIAGTASTGIARSTPSSIPSSTPTDVPPSPASKPARTRA